MNERLKKLIFKKLYEDLFQVEIIHYEESIWFINRKEKFWYFEYQKSGVLWWRYQFFHNFFKLFCLERREFEPILSEWLEEVLNCKVNTTYWFKSSSKDSLEEVLNCKVNTTINHVKPRFQSVEEVLNCKVNTTMIGSPKKQKVVEEVLNCKVNTAYHQSFEQFAEVERVLNCKVNTNNLRTTSLFARVEDVLNHETNTTDYTEEYNTKEV